MLQIMFATINTNTQPVDETYFGYLTVLKDVPEAELWAVITQVMSNPGSFPPSAGDLLELWRKAMGMIPPDDGAMACVASIRKAVWQVGYIGTPTFTDPITAKVVSSYGWREICLNDNPDALFAHLRDMYKAYATRAATSARTTTEYNRLIESVKAKQLEVKHERDGESPEPRQ